VRKVIDPSSWREIPVILGHGTDDDLLTVDRNTMLTYFKEFGAVLFRSFSIGMETFKAFVELYSTTRISYPGTNRLEISPDRKIQTVDSSTSSIPLHSELSHTPFRPDICWFYCVTAPDRGGETILCDGSLLASELPSELKRLFEANILRYRRTTSIGVLQQLLGLSDAHNLHETLRSSLYSRFYEVRDGNVYQDFVAPPLHRPKFLEKPAFANNVIHNFRPGRPLTYPTFASGCIIPEDVIQTFINIASRCSLDLAWQNQDLLMLDNTRFMHGRHHIVDPRRTVWTQFSDADF